MYIVNYVQFIARTPHSLNDFFKQIRKTYLFKKSAWGFPGGLVVKNLLANAGDVSSIPSLVRSHTPWGN